MSPPSKKPKDDRIHPISQWILTVCRSWMSGLLVWVLGIAVIGTAALDFFWPRHDHLEFAAMRGFYALFGFGAFVFAVMVGWFVIRRFLGRDEDYWDKEAGDE